MATVGRRRGLNALFDELNQRYFKGRLPRFDVKFTDSIRGLGVCQSRRILLRSNLVGDQLRQTLLHEMCHIGTPNHGRRFQAKLDRLAAQGETWAAAEADEIRNAFTWNQEMANLRGKLEEIALTMIPRPDFHQVLDWLIESLFIDVTRKRLLHSIPGLPAAWRKACKSADKLIARSAEHEHRGEVGTTSPVPLPRATRE